jgi:hypothetical protein
MGDMDNLFININSWVPSKESTKTENFFTEIFAYLLRNDDDLRNAFFAEFKQLAEFKFDPMEKVEINTQVRRKFKTSEEWFIPDIQITSDNNLLVIENKIDATLTKNQVDKYFEYLSETDDKRNKGFLLLLKRPEEDTEYAKNKFYKGLIRWRDIYKCFNKFYEDHKKNSRNFPLLEQFLELIDNKNMAPFEKIDRKYVECLPDFWKKTRAVKQLQTLCVEIIERKYSVKENRSEIRMSLKDCKVELINSFSSENKNVKFSMGLLIEDDAICPYLSLLKTSIKKRKDYAKIKNELSHSGFEDNNHWFELFSKNKLDPKIYKTSEKQEAVVIDFFKTNFEELSKAGLIDTQTENFKQKS